jgi:uncharacterized protein with von Willebrand factor type A (vWA) domain
VQGFRFFSFVPPPRGDDPFGTLLDLFLRLLQFTGGDAGEALSWLTELDKEHGLTSAKYGMGDFIQDLREKGFVREEGGKGEFKVTGKAGQVIRSRSLEEIFGKLKKTRRGEHHASRSGSADEWGAHLREFTFGDRADQIDITASLQNAQVNHGTEHFNLTEGDLEVRERESKSQTSTVLMIDISHSMILYGEDRITPAKKVAMALAELISTKYPADTLDILVFGNDAWPVSIKDLPYLQVGPYHTNTYAGLELAMDMLRRRKTTNRQIFMITDGKPTCLREGNGYYQNSFGLDRRIVNKTLGMAARCRRLNIPITTFMIATDPYLKEFVQEFTRVNNGRAFYSSLNGLGDFLFEDYERNRRKRVR